MDQDQQCVIYPGRGVRRTIGLYSVKPFNLRINMVYLRALDFLL